MTADEKTARIKVIESEIASKKLTYDGMDKESDRLDDVGQAVRAQQIVKQMQDIQKEMDTLEEEKKGLLEG